jgi:hypothetical protein
MIDVIEALGMHISSCILCRGYIDNPVDPSCVEGMGLLQKVKDEAEDDLD